MKDQIINLETALSAKNAGFNIRCENVYAETLAHEDYNRHTGDEYDVEYVPPRVLSRDGYDDFIKIVCEAPTQSLLQKWIREEHEFIILINYSYWDDNFMFEICGRRVNSDILLGIDFSNRFETYEESLEFGLLETLQLI